MTSLTLVRRIAARPSIVFDALTTPDGIRLWWGPDDGPVLIAETDVRLGGRFRVRFRMIDGTEHESSGEYLEVVRPARLVMSWCWTIGGDPAETGEESRVERRWCVDATCSLTLAGQVCSFHAVQAQRHAPSPHSPGALQGHELVGLRGGSAPSR